MPFVSRWGSGFNSSGLDPMCVGNMRLRDCSASAFVIT
jgi:hypothetical protein